MKFFRILTVLSLIFAMQSAAFSQEEIPTPAPEAGEEAAEKTDAQLKEEIGSLIEQLGADNWEERNNALQKLMEFGEAAVPQLIEARNSEDYEVKTRVEQILKMFHWVSPENKKEIDSLVEKYAKKSEEKVDTDEEKETRKKEVRGIIDEIKKIEFSDFYLVGKLKPGVESDKDLIAEVLGGMLNLCYWTGADGYHISGNKIVMEDGEEIPMPAGPWRIEEKGDKIYINGQELQLPTKIDKDISPVEVLGKITGGCQGSIDLKLDCLEILEGMKAKKAVKFIIRALRKDLESKNEELMKLQHGILEFLSAVVEDGPEYSGDGGDAGEIGDAANQWLQWWRTARNEEPYNK